MALLIYVLIIFFTLICVKLFLDKNLNSIKMQKDSILILLFIW